MTQRTLFDADPLDACPAPPAQRHSATSVDAARAIEPKASTLRREVLDFLRRRGVDGATRQEAEAALGMSGNTVRPRVVELMKVGLVAETRRTRNTPSGRKAFVLVATEFAKPAE